MAEVGTALLCIFNDRPMPGARESGKILFVTCWRCAEAPAPQLILGKMRMPAVWPAGWAGWSGAGELGAAQGLLGIVVIPWHGSCSWVCMGWVGLGHLEAGALSPSPVYKGVNSFLPSQLQQQLLASQYQFHRLALPVHPLRALSGLFWGKSALGSGCRHHLIPHIYTQVPITHLLYPGFLRCKHLRDTAALCGRLRFIHYFISTRL